MIEKQSAWSDFWQTIPQTAKVIAVGGAVFIAGLTIILFMVQDAKPHLSAKIILPPLVGLIVAFCILLVGYINGDAGRRGMNRLLWTLLVIFVPNALGFILYFLLRKAPLIPCPQCSASLKTEFNYCPKCNFRLTPTCSGCQRSIHEEDAFCPYCGQAVSEAAPSQAGA
jgi:putative effector of murein hydrolase LrgA (UPF0299 family)